MTEITITRPDDFHLHLRDGETLKTVVAHTANEFARAVIMPNLVPPVTNIELAKQYKGRILKALPDELLNPCILSLASTAIEPILI